HPGEQPAIVDQPGWQEVQALLAHNSQSRAVAQRSQSRALLQGLVRCRPCDCAMTPAHVTNRNKRYRYYTCLAAQKKGWHTCPSKSVPAQALERYVLEQVAPHARDVDWATRTPGERAARLRRLVTRIDYDGTSQQVAITLQSNCPPREKAS